MPDLYDEDEMTGPGLRNRDVAETLRRETSVPDILSDAEIAAMWNRWYNDADAELTTAEMMALFASHAALWDALQATVAALKVAMAQWECYADTPRDFDGGPYLADSTDPEDLEAAIYRKCQAALGLPAVRALTDDA